MSNQKIASGRTIGGVRQKISVNTEFIVLTDFLPNEAPALETSVDLAQYDPSTFVVANDFP